MEWDLGLFWEKWRIISFKHWLSFWTNPPTVQLQSAPSTVGSEQAWLHSWGPWLPGFLCAFVGAHFFWSCASEEEQRISRDLYPFLSFNYRDHPSSSRLMSLSKTLQSQALTLLECLAPKEADSSLFQLRYPMIHWFGLIAPCLFVFLSLSEGTWWHMQMVFPLSWADCFCSEVFVLWRTVAVVWNQYF